MVDWVLAIRVISIQCLLQDTYKSSNTAIKLVRPGYLTQIIFNVVLVTATVDRFLSYGLRYELMSKLVYSIPVAVYIVFQRWEDLFIAHIPIDQWV